MYNKYFAARGVTPAQSHKSTSTITVHNNGIHVFFSGVGNNNYCFVLTNFSTAAEIICSDG